eukprot:682881-Pyramimonas_sp.AAC.1
MGTLEHINASRPPLGDRTICISTRFVGGGETIPISVIGVAPVLLGMPDDHNQHSNLGSFSPNRGASP